VKILLVNQPWFSKELREHGHEVMCVGTAPYCEIRVSWFMHLDTILKGLPSSFSPDRIVFYDNSMPIVFPGFESLSIPTLFYAVDTHHHLGLHKYLAGVVNTTIVAQKDYIPPLLETNPHTSWLPLWASTYREPEPTKDYGVVFIGTLNKQLNPDRVAFFDALQKETKMLCTTGQFTQYFPKAEIVINQTVKGDLNFRIFEAMACGPMVLTERAPNGLFELFTDGEHLATYEKGNIKEAASQIERYLQNPRQMRDIAASGRQEVMKKHLPEHRTERLLELLENPPPRTYASPHLVAMANFLYLAHQLLPDNRETATSALVLSLKELSVAVKLQEPITIELGCHALTACLEFDRLTMQNRGHLLLTQLIEAYPDNQIMQFMHVRELLNSGKESEARAWVTERFSEPAEETFRKIEDLVHALTPYV
jgi:hypothetical protein